ncbi:MAG: hypothetical protein Aurels2KO_35520 [Aureliella sp.]
MSDRHYKAGSNVVFSKSKSSVSPGPRAIEITPEGKGDGYQYVVEKFWTVKASHDDGTLTLVTRRGKEHRIPADHPQLRPARWWERLLYRSRFPLLND